MAKAPEKTAREEGSALERKPWWGRGEARHFWGGGLGGPRAPGHFSTGRVKHPPTSHPLWAPPSCLRPPQNIQPPAGLHSGPAPPHLQSGGGGGACCGSGPGTPQSQQSGDWGQREWERRWARKAGEGWRGQQCCPQGWPEDHSQLSTYPGQGQSHPELDLGTVGAGEGRGRARGIPGESLQSATPCPCTSAQSSTRCGPQATGPGSWWLRGLAHELRIDQF